MSVEHRGNDTDRGKQSYWRKAGSSATFSTINPAWTGLGLNPASAVREAGE